MFSGDIMQYVICVFILVAIVAIFIVEGGKKEEDPAELFLNCIWALPVTFITFAFLVINIIS